VEFQSLTSAVGRVNSDSNPKALEDAVKYVEETLPGVLESVPGGKKGELKTFTDRAEAIKGSWVVTECGESAANVGTSVAAVG
jgi:hypothetical protein